MKLNHFNRLFLALFVSISISLVASAANSEEDALKLVQQAKYNIFTGNWDVHLNTEIKTIEQGIKNSMPALDYTLVDEKIDSPKLTTLIFRGAGDQKIVIKLKRYGRRQESDFFNGEGEQGNTFWKADSKGCVLILFLWR